MSWYKQDRNLFERVWAKDAKMVSIYIYLHCHAYVQDGMLGGRMVRRGSCPTSRAAIMEGTGLSEHDVKLRLRRLMQYGEIIVNSSNLGTVITLCDYYGCNEQEDLFSANPSSQSPSQLPNESPSQSPIYIDIKKEDNNILRSHFIPSKKERESDRSLVYEIKAIYNKTFDGVLRKWERLSSDMCIKVENCISRYGRQSVDMVFDQVRHEKFSLGQNDTGFIADFAFIFKLKNYEGYLGRYELRKRNNLKPQQQPKVQEDPQPKAGGSWIDAYNENNNWKPKMK